MTDHPETPIPPAAAAAVVGGEEEFAREAFQREQSIKRAYADVQGQFWKLAEQLYEFREGQFWTGLGYPSLEEFLAQPELGISRRQFFLMVSLWRDLVVTHHVEPSKLAAIEPTKVREVAPAIKRGEVSVDDALDDARELSYRDVREKYRPERRDKHGQEPDDSTPLDADSEPIKMTCPTCGSFVDADRINLPDHDAHDEGGQDGR